MHDFGLWCLIFVVLYRFQILVVRQPDSRQRSFSRSAGFLFSLLIVSLAMQKIFMTRVLICQSLGAFSVRVLPRKSAYGGLKSSHALRQLFQDSHPAIKSLIYF